VVREVKTQKRRYNAPPFEVLDINAAKAQLEAKAILEDEDAQQMRSVIEKQLEKKSGSSPGRST
jgi:hypothetical protein